jgi:uncharacterized protein (UPF0332 family)
MSFDWSTYIDLAKTLNGMTEDSAQRSAVSRAYYSAFHAASGTLKTNGIQTFPKDDRKSHDKVWNVYKESQKRDCRRIGNRGARLMEQRHDADYDAGLAFNPTDVATLITDVESLVTAMQGPNNLPEGFIGPLKPKTKPTGNRFVAAVKAVAKVFGS